MPTPSGGIASVATTGVPAGTDLTAAKGDVNITKDGTVIDGRDISGNIWIDADDVTIKNSRVAGGGFSVIQVKSGSKNVTITDVEIDGMGVQAGAMGIMGPATVTGADISGVENGLTPGSGSVLKGNYVHDLKSPGSPHYDGIQIDGGLSNITVTGNYVDLHEHSQTSAVMIDNYFGPISNIKVDGNRLIGGGYTVYSDGQFSGGPITGVSFTNNQLGKGRYGYASIVGNDPVWSGNVDVETGETVRG
ncbi:right-handed parallel beta-helix repeat-containing protein [Aeromicrobium sp. S22]|uniref:right-handed parallel beta-helix repeat-containing protein n=1 Tax=Aeromicrobium sp. S22 TaxID=2662029 RepID=UPI001892B2CE|nr:right-handed parallel beta-helix repeat-containing protein [Aeromicrobium sp. S22]